MIREYIEVDRGEYDKRLMRGSEEIAWTKYNVAKACDEVVLTHSYHNADMKAVVAFAKKLGLEIAGELVMKEWTIAEFVAECAALCWNEYTYDYDRMPDGMCNGHRVGAYKGSWHSIVIDGCICNMARYSDEQPNGSVRYNYYGRTLTALEYVKARLMEAA